MLVSAERAPDITANAVKKMAFNPRLADRLD
jgi:hypothetical protein